MRREEVLLSIRARDHLGVGRSTQPDAQIRDGTAGLMSRGGAMPPGEGRDGV